MALVPFLSNSKTWTSGRLPEPWDNARRAIYEFLLQNVDETTGNLIDSHIKLPDERKPADNKMRWGAGSMEGAFGHHFGKEDDAKGAERIFSTLKAVINNPSETKIKRFYDLISDDSALNYVDPLLELIVNDPVLNDEKLVRFSIWLAKSAPDRGPVKVGIALAGVTTSGEAEEIICTLGKHEEFTLYAVVALGHSAANPEEKIWELAQSVTGWGRIQAVERLQSTQDERIKAWLLREGYRNGVMDEYLACICARTGDLLTALQDAPDEKLLIGARDIIRALITGGPAEDMTDYADGPEVTNLFLELISERNLDLAYYLAASAIQKFVTSIKYNWSETKGAWTPDARAEISKLASSILAREDWKVKAEAGLRSLDSSTFYEANQAAKLLGIDTWGLHFERIKADPKTQGWWEVMQTNDPERIRKVVVLACKVLPLNEIASGPSDSLGLGEKYWAHSALDFVLQDLRKCPGDGWGLIQTGLQSPVIRNRNLALKALSAWPRSSWPDDAKSFLKNIEKIEPKDDVRKRIGDLLAGRDISK